MADLDHPHEDNSSERDEEERRRREKRPSLDEEIARKYDPARLEKIVLSGAGRGERLDLAARSDIERRLPGYDFSKVRVFRGPLAEEVTARHKADAITVANTGMILMRDSARSSPGTTSGQALLAHELTHVAQAQRGMHFALEGGGQGGGNGAHEEEAEHVEAAVTGHQQGDDQSSQTGAKNEKAKQEHKRRKILERALDMMNEEMRLQRDRHGGNSF